ncbi:RNA polymerase factor sigma-54 [Fredinandcohnia quinoae]|uniref:RNA polymerase factor sigma-54 n=1 Tax=Fredinandcohnia quinoae TaxID=2918902 RepID=A0AAW5E3E6_9BACI|nr:RNA polymerase factor sigma-54 [Fredinandcohnia sp. SECRCQ15]MCH1625760.1 RNA polymerase factor sigma-54 [Fredinandcohnia sp. SECRCQ15]
MNLNTGLFQQQTLKLVMTKELTQAITLLQYSSLDLTKFLEEQSVENPLIELKQNEFSRTRKISKVTGESYTNPIDYIEKNDISLYQHLLAQLTYVQLSSKDKAIIEYMIQLLDENGYFYFAEEEIAEELNVDVSIIEKSLSFIQKLDPIGVGARSLQECLLLQLKNLSERNVLAEEIIGQHFLLFADKSWKEISRIVDVKLSDIQHVYDLIQTLQPRPGALFQGNEPSYIIPEIEIQVENGTVQILLQDDYLPKVSLNLQYYNHFINEQDPGIKSYLQEKVEQCQWIMKSIDQRKQTLKNVMNEIVLKQLDFFLKGPNFLKPLTMSEVADTLGIHESTVSRATKDKFVQTPFGIFEMKHFFSRNIQTTGDSDMSSLQVRTILKQLIDEENKHKPLSDQEIVGIMQLNHGILVSRRTIAKYRDQLKIPSSSKRKRYEK